MNITATYRLILQYLAHHVLDVYLSAAHLHRAGIAYIRTFAALDAQAGIEHVDIVYTLMRLAGAGIHALVAAYTLVGVVVQILSHVYGFGIMAPRTAHIAALEKNRRSYSGAVVEREALYVRYHAVHLRIPHYNNLRYLRFNKAAKKLFCFPAI